MGNAKWTPRRRKRKHLLWDIMDSTLCHLSQTRSRSKALGKQKNSFGNPVRLRPIDKEGQVQVIVETPRGSRNKYSFDPEQRMFRLKTVLPEGMSFPHNFGFIPSTRAEDGDPIDVLLMMDEPAFPGCVVHSRLIGVIEAEQWETDNSKERNDRLIAVSTASHTHSHVHSVNDLNPKLLKEVEQFFVNYNAQLGKKFKVLAIKGPKSATRCMTQAKKHKKAA
ncbi:MAG: inorganic diphosphatase [Acidobacteria bacterium]|nr:inorganic diphosphatase [Acidobacteriota bacterium]